MRYLTGTSDPESPATTARQILNVEAPIIWLRVTARGGSANILGRGQTTTTEGRQLGYGESIEVEAPRQGTFQPGDFWATGSGNVDWEAVIL